MDICIANLPGDIAESDLREVFESFGLVGTVDVVKHRFGYGFRGFGFVGMPARSEGLSAVLGVHGRSLNGHAVTATEIRARDPVSGACCARCDCQRGK